jgi:hypothetical protein
LTAELDGQWRRVPSQPVAITLAGKGAGQVMTDQLGRACLTTPAPQRTGPAAVQGRFAGTRGYLPSVADGSILILPVATTAGQITGFGGLLPPPVNAPPPAQPAPFAQAGLESGGAQAQLQANAQAEAQAQAQSQTHSVAQLQPGVMAQERRRTQLATQTSNLGPLEVQPMLASRRQTSPAMVTGVMIAGSTLLLGLGFLGRRPALRTARIRRGRHGSP